MKRQRMFCGLETSQEAEGHTHLSSLVSLFLWLVLRRKEETRATARKDYDILRSCLRHLPLSQLTWVRMHPHSLGLLTTGSPAGGVVWRVVVLLKQVCHWKLWELKTPAISSTAVHSASCLWFRCNCSARCLGTGCPHSTSRGLGPSGTLSPRELSYELPWPWCNECTMLSPPLYFLLWYLSLIKYHIFIRWSLGECKSQTPSAYSQDWGAGGWHRSRVKCLLQVPVFEHSGPRWRCCGDVEGLSWGNDRLGEAGCWGWALGCSLLHFWSRRRDVYGCLTFTPVMPSRPWWTEFHELWTRISSTFSKLLVTCLVLSVAKLTVLRGQECCSSKGRHRVAECICENHMLGYSFFEFQGLDSIIKVFIDGLDFF